MIKLLLNRNRPPRIDLFSLYILFSHFRPLDALKGIFLLFFFSVVTFTFAKPTFEKTILSISITRSEMGKQNIQAKEV